jgi:type VI secretion system protein ImpE
MDAQGLLREGRLDETVEALSDVLRQNPQDARSRTFLFEVLCFRGDYQRAAKHLAMLGDGGKDAAAGALLYGASLRAEEIRAEMFVKNEFPEQLTPEESSFHGVLNGKPFSTLTDSDERIGPRLEVFAGGNYLWIPLRHIASLEIQPPTRLRDLLWASAMLRMGSAFALPDLGQVLLPALAPLTFRHPDPQVRLGRRTEWSLDDRDREIAAGQKVLIVDGEEIPFLEIRTLEIAQTAAVGR